MKATFVEELLKDEFSPEDLKYIVNFKYEEKTADQWLDEANKAEGFDQKGNPAWYEPHASAIYTITFAKLNLLAKNEIKKA